ncbi:hypothetical protein HPB47_016616, partial [Ixodes persulcatus]
MARARHYHRLNDVSTLASASSEFSPSTDELREMIRQVVREELKKLLPAADPLASLSIAKVVREEHGRAIEPRAPVNPAPLEQPTQLGLRGFHPDDSRPRYAFLKFEFCVDRIANKNNLDIESRSLVAGRAPLQTDSASWRRVKKLAETLGRGTTGSRGKSLSSIMMNKNYLIANRDCLLDAFTVRDFISFCKSGKNVVKWATCVEAKVAKRKPILKDNHLVKEVE